MDDHCLHLLIGPGVQKRPRLFILTKFHIHHIGLALLVDVKKDEFAFLSLLLFTIDRLMRIERDTRPVTSNLIELCGDLYL